VDFAIKGLPIGIETTEVQGHPGLSIPGLLNELLFEIGETSARTGLFSRCSAVTFMGEAPPSERLRSECRSGIDVRRKDS
jgi:hypothetical protein